MHRGNVADWRRIGSNLGRTRCTSLRLKVDVGKRTHRTEDQGGNAAGRQELEGLVASGLCGFGVPPSAPMNFRSESVNQAESETRRQRPGRRLRNRPPLLVGVLTSRESRVRMAVGIVGAYRPPIVSNTLSAASTSLDGISIPRLRARLSG